MGFVIQEKSYKNDPTSVNSERIIVSSSSSLGILREKLVQNIGIKRIGGFLFHFGYDMGVNAAKQAMEREKSIEQLIKDGPKWHVKSGQIRDFEHKCVVEYGVDGQVVSVVGQGKWVGSYEAYEHKKRIGQADAPVCHTLLGYSSGFMSTIFGRELLARELTCTGAGHAECRWVIKLKEDWHQDMHDDIYQENHSPILQELEFTYDQLLEQTNLVTKLSSFQKRLTQEIVDGSDLQSVTNRAYEILKVPIIIDDLNLDSISFAGVSEERIKSINEESKKKLPGYVVKNRKKYAVPFRKKVMELSKGFRYIVPILVENEILGYCSTLLTEEENYHTNEHYFFVEHLANAVALILLNEKRVLIQMNG
ncbi:V4R domain-containing protein [Bacillus sp. JCM 19041]|uniref:XylR N-terminal domain-containing protein n=1 Tax=Bacillus sp. JCM 19041 TaxID=1460637 RepID=UPI0006D11C5B